MVVMLEHPQRIPRVREALVVKGPGQLELACGVPMPTEHELKPGQVLVRVACVALNPSDAKMVEAGEGLGAIAGLDFAGTVVRLGPLGTVGSIALGARVCGVAFGYSSNNNSGDGTTGAFTDYAIAEAHLLVPVPDAMSLQDAATLPVSLLTGGMVLFHVLKLQERADQLLGTEDKHVLVYGGSTTSGLIMIQLLKHAGLKAVATCSPRNFGLVKAAGAVAVYDYGSERCAENIRADTDDRLRLAIDCITSPESTRLCYAALGSATLSARCSPPRYVALDKFSATSHTRRAVRPSWVFAMSAFGVAIDWKGGYECGAKPQDREFAKRWMQEDVPALLASGAVRPPRARVVGGALAAVPGGLRLLREQGNVSGEKLICVLE